VLARQGYHLVHQLLHIKITSRQTNSDKASSRFYASAVILSQKVFQFFNGLPKAIAYRKISRGAINHDPDKKSDCHIGQGCDAGKFP
jgi:transposase